MCCVHMLQQTGLDVRGLFVDYGQAAARFEERASTTLANHFDIPLTRICIRHDRTFGSGEIVGRNLLLISTAVTFAPVSRGLIVIGVHAGTPYYDCSSGFVRSVATSIEEVSDGKFSVLAPLSALVKKEIFEYALKWKLPCESAYSCEQGMEIGCGVCLSCQDQRVLQNLLEPD